VSTICRHSSRVVAFLQAVARPEFRGPRSASVAQSQVWLGLPAGHFQSGGTCRIHAARARRWSSRGELRAIWGLARQNERKFHLLFRSRLDRGSLLQSELGSILTRFCSDEDLLFAYILLMWISLQQPGLVADDTYVYHCLIIVISIIIGGGIRRVSGKVLQSCMSEYSKKHYIVFKNLVCVVSPKHTMCCRMIRRLRAFLSGVSPVSAWYMQSQRGGMPLCTSTDERVR